MLAFGRRTFALEFARKAGAKESIPLEDPSPVIDQVEGLTRGRFCEVVIEATGKQAALDFASHITGIRGRLVIAGYHQDDFRKINLRLWNWRGLDVINAHERIRRSRFEAFKKRSRPCSRARWIRVRC